MDAFIWINKNVRLDKPNTFIKTDGKFYADEIQKIFCLSENPYVNVKNKKMNHAKNNFRKLTYK